MMNEHHFSFVFWLVKNYLMSIYILWYLNRWFLETFRMTETVILSICLTKHYNIYISEDTALAYISFEMV